MTRQYTLRDPEGAPRSRIDYNTALNDEQRAVVEASGGKMLVLAGAGSGKTRAITYRVARLVERGVPTSAILLVTFTNRAAREMSGRVGELLGVDMRASWAGTFHGIGRRLLREYGAHVAGVQGTTILDGEDAESLMKQVISERVAKRPDAPRFPSAGAVYGLLSRSINTGRPADELLVSDMPHFAHWQREILDCMAGYQSRKQDLGLVDFDDLLVWWHRMMHDMPDLSRTIAGRFQHVLVDEYQDTNALQASIVDACSIVHGNLTVVGDDCQSIYSFRGADFRNILTFEERHPGTQRFLLRNNYRSSPEIVRVANLSIAHNRAQFAKELVAMQPPGPLPAWVRCRDESEQNRFVAQRVLDLRDEGVPLQRIAVLYRAHFQSMELQLELNRRNIPFEVRSGQRFFEQRHVKDVLAFLRIVENPRDELALQRVLTLGEGIGPATSRKAFEWIRNAASLQTALASDGLRMVFPARARPSWETLRNTLAPLCEERLRTDAAAAVEFVVSTFYEAHASRLFDNAPNRMRELEMLATYAARQGSVGAFLDSLALATDLSGMDSEGGGSDEQIVLSTIHQAKGLEFHACFVIAAVDEQFPLSRATGSSDELEEERRLFYVATTRAERELYFTVAAIGWDRQRMPIIHRPSRFLTEVASAGPGAFEIWELR